MSTQFYIRFFRAVVLTQMHLDYLGNFLLYAKAGENGSLYMLMSLEGIDSFLQEQMRITFENE